MAYYSNTALPERPEYDILSYPFAVAVLVYPRQSEDWSEVRLYYSATPFCYDSVNGIVTNTERQRRFRVYRAADGDWGTEQDQMGKVMLIPGLGEDSFHRIWTEQRLADDQGRVYLGAGAVTGGDWQGLNSWMAGVLQGMNLTPFRTAVTGAPVFEPKYQYNELVLPGVPGLLTEQKYVVIAWVPSEGCYRAWGGLNIRTEYNALKLVSSASKALTFYVSDYTGGVWSVPRSQAVAKNSAITSYVVEPVWCNLDLIEVRTSKLILAGSAPVSVVRIDPDVKYDPERWLMGWYLGHRIARGRHGSEATE